MIFLAFAAGKALTLVLILATAWAAGKPLLDGLEHGRAEPGGEPPAAGLAVAVGMAVLAQILLLLGLLGWLRIPVVLALVVSVHIAAFPHWRRSITALIAGRAGGIRGGGWKVAILVGHAALPFAMTLYPPLGFDQTLYHLPYAQAFAASGGVPFLPDLRFPVFPQLTELLATAVLLLGDEIATQVVGWSAMAACVVLASSWVGEMSSRIGGALAAAVLVGSPAALYLAASGYVEPVLALFGLAALYAAERVRHAPQPGALGWALLAGFLAGSAASVKYLGLLFLPAAMLVLAWGKRPPRWRRVAMLGAAAMLALAPTYGRLLWHTGNPLFPFYSEIFGADPWSADSFLGPRGDERLARAATQLWDATFRRDLLGSLPPYSPVLFLALPLGVLGALREPRLRPLLAAGLLFLALAPIHGHYLLAILPVWAVLFGGGFGPLVVGSTAGRRIGQAAAILLALGGPLYAARYIADLGPPPRTAAAQARLLARELPLYPAVAHLERVAPGATVYAVGAERMVAYFGGRWLGDHSGPASYSRLAHRSSELGGLASALEELGVDYFLVPRVYQAWQRSALADRRLSCAHADEAMALYRVLPVAAAARSANSARGVGGCGLLLADGFESGDTGAWRDHGR